MMRSSVISPHFDSAAKTARRRCSSSLASPDGSTITGQGTSGSCGQFEGYVVGRRDLVCRRSIHSDRSTNLSAAARVVSASFHWQIYVPAGRGIAPFGNVAAIRAGDLASRHGHKRRDRERRQEQPRGEGQGARSQRGLSPFAESAQQKGTVPFGGIAQVRFGRESVISRQPSIYRSAGIGALSIASGPGGGGIGAGPIGRCKPAPQLLHGPRRQQP